MIANATITVRFGIVRETHEKRAARRPCSAVLLGVPYRAGLDFGDAAIERAQATVNAIEGFYHYLLDEVKAAAGRDADAGAGAWIAKTRAEIDAAMDDDLDWPRAVAAIARVIDRLDPADVGDPSSALAAVREWDRMLGILEPER